MLSAITDKTKKQQLSRFIHLLLQRSEAEVKGNPTGSKVTGYLMSCAETYLCSIENILRDPSSYTDIMLAAYMASDDHKKHQTENAASFVTHHRRFHSASALLSKLNIAIQAEITQLQKWQETLDQEFAQQELAVKEKTTASSPPSPAAEPEMKGLTSPSKTDSLSVQLDAVDPLPHQTAAYIDDQIKIHDDLAALHLLQHELAILQQAQGEQLSQLIPVGPAVAAEEKTVEVGAEQKQDKFIVQLAELQQQLTTLRPAKVAELGTLTDPGSHGSAQKKLDLACDEQPKYVLALRAIFVKIRPLFAAIKQSYDFETSSRKLLARESRHIDYSKDPETKDGGIIARYANRDRKSTNNRIDAVFALSQKINGYFLQYKAPEEDQHKKDFLDAYSPLCDLVTNWERPLTRLLHGMTEQKIDDDEILASIDTSNTLFKGQISGQLDKFAAIIAKEKQRLEHLLKHPEELKEVSFKTDKTIPGMPKSITFGFGEIDSLANFSAPFIYIFKPKALVDVQRLLGSITAIEQSLVEFRRASAAFFEIIDTAANAKKSDRIITCIKHLEAADKQHTDDHLQHILNPPSIIRKLGNPPLHPPSASPPSSSPTPDSPSPFGKEVKDVAKQQVSSVTTLLPARRGSFLGRMFASGPAKKAIIPTSSSFGPGGASAVNPGRLDSTVPSSGAGSSAVIKPATKTQPDHQRHRSYSVPEDTRDKSDEMAVTMARVDAAM